MLENVEKNLRTWDQTYVWSKDGDEWDGQAAACGVPYEDWKESMVGHLLVPNVGKATRVIEIAPGHGRWTAYLARLAAHVTVVDLSPTCLDFCRHRFRDCRNIDYVRTPGDSLPGCRDGETDFVWSYDSFVHMDRLVVAAYLAEIRRVLRPGGTAIIHHANVPDPDTHRQDDAPGWRSAMNANLMRALAVEAGLSVISQFVYWDAENRIGCPRFDDRFTTMQREGGA